MSRFSAAYVQASLRASPVKTALLAALSVVLVTVVGWQLLSGPRTAAARNEAFAQPVVVAPVGSPEAFVAEAPRGPVHKIADLPQQSSRDPFAADWSLYPALPRKPGPVPAATMTPEEPTPASVIDDPLQLWSDQAVSLIVLKHTSAGEGTGRALIGGRVVRDGEEFDGVRVAEIGPRHVVLTDGRRSVVLRMREPR